MSAKVVADITISVDGFVAGPHDGLGKGLGEGGEALHNWVMGGPWTYAGEHPFQASGVDQELLDEVFAEAGASIIGRRMYDVVDGWGDEAAFPFPIFVVTSRPHPRRDLGTSSYTFVTDGIHSALEQARAVAGEKTVGIGGGARIIQEYLAAGLVDELVLHIAPLVLGQGTRLFEDVGRLGDLEIIWVRQSPYATHIRYRIDR